jgi:hypothetical protein
VVGFYGCANLAFVRTAFLLAVMNPMRDRGSFIIHTVGTQIRVMIQIKFPIEIVRYLRANMCGFLLLK